MKQTLLEASIYFKLISKVVTNHLIFSITAQNIQFLKKKSCQILFWLPWG